MCDFQNEVQVPTYFMCPISLEIMKDPVTLSTGITYDRDNIEKWLFSQNNTTCPVTKQVVIDLDLTPNLTLHRLIQSWCTLNPSPGVKTCPDPRPPITKTEIIKLVKDLKHPHLKIKSLEKLKTIVLENERNKRLLESVGAVDQLINSCMTSSSPAGDVTGVDQALTILYHLQLLPTSIKSLLEKMVDFVDPLTWVMQRATCPESRTYAVMLLKSIFEVAEPMQMTSLSTTLFMELVNILTGQSSQKTTDEMFLEPDRLSGQVRFSKDCTKATLELLINVCSFGRNRIKAAEVGAVAVLIDTLLNNNEKRVSEMIIILLDQICQCAEGRAELLKHKGGLAVVSKKIFRVSSVASESAVRILYSVMRFSGERSVVQEMLQLGVVGKLCLVMQADCGKKMKEKAKEILKMHSRVWKYT